MRITLVNENLELLPEKAAFWPARRTLFIADPHFGKAATFRLAGLFVPRGTTQGALRRIDVMLEQTGATRIIFLGDFLHARRGRSTQVLSELQEWRAQHRELELLLVRGNHDRGAGDPPADLDIRCVDGPYHEGPFALAHHPMAVPGAYVLAGHLHPCIALRGLGRYHEQLPCFWFSGEVGVLPAFGEFTGCAKIQQREEDRVFVIGAGEVIALREETRRQ
ncbi:MAG TPA: ligase-associated DNA damage response endonuclease PdeM [Gemmatimonadales bacterium]|nr:ligase-associated DNA damage response endonuclease PdeM [Gemmatimonadales bacterium]